MEELLIEEKAKRYDGNYKAYIELINRLEDVKEAIKKQNYGIAMDVLCKSYPEFQVTTHSELKECEDERIRKEIITFIVTTPKERNNHKKWIAWLEAQGEHDNFRNKIQIGDKVTRNEDGVLVNLSQLNRVAKKQGEQKPTDKVETKFKVGDWLQYRNAKPFFVEEITKQGYVNCISCLPFDWENEIHRWTIQDAKDGDVLVSESTCGLGTWYCIFKSLDGDESMTVYCYLTRDGRFETKKELCFDKDPYNTNPATKEQRDLLFQKMHDAGYEWDAEKKELKKIEQKPAWSEKYIADVFEKVGLAKIAREQENDALTRALQSAMIELAKYSVVPQIRQEWSEEDEVLLKLSVENLTELKDRYGEKYGRVGECIDWLESKLESFKPQNTWKPSDEQVNTLEYYMHTLACNEHKEILFGLYADLKKLMEE